MAEASAPASSANLGPGFDCLAVALELRCRVEAVEASSWVIEHTSTERPAPGCDDAVLAAAQRAVGERHPLALTVHNEIPLGRGLGSSSAAACAGALAAWRAVGVEPHQERLFELVADFEGHPDNAAATVYGGLVLVTPPASVHRLPWSFRLRPVVAIPHEPYRTADARAVLPETYSSDVVVRSLGRMAALVGGIVSGDDGLLREAGGDELHESLRARVRPDAADLIETARRAGAAHAAWSGAGPSVIALAGADVFHEVVRRLAVRLGDRGRVITPSIATQGAV